MDEKDKLIQELRREVDRLKDELNRVLTGIHLDALAEKEEDEFEIRFGERGNDNGTV